MKLASSACAALVCALATTLATPRHGSAQEDGAPGNVQIPLARYEALTQTEGRAAPRHAYSQVQLAVQVAEDGSAEVSVEASARVIGEGVALVPLAAGGALIEASVDGRPAELVSSLSGLAFAAEAGSYRVAYRYRAEARRYGDARVLSLPAPSAPVELRASIATDDPGVSVFPATSASVTSSDGSTTITASVPMSAAVSIAWREGGSAGVTLSRARYRGTLEGDTVRFEAELTVELDGAERVLVPLFPAGVALEDVTVDRVEAAIAITERSGVTVGRHLPPSAGVGMPSRSGAAHVIDEAGAIAVPVAGRGRHRIAAAFRVPVESGEGLPSIALGLVPTPVCAFELRLPGERELTVEPTASVTTSRERGETVARFFVPMTEEVSIRWAEAIPDDASEVELSAHASIVHVVRPDEGVLGVTAHASWEITRGATSRAEFALPDGVQVTRVESAAGVVSDWRVSADRLLTVFLDREVADTLALEVHYERPWPVATRTSEAIEVPLLRARGVHRQRGMTALLSAGELTLEAREEVRVTRVGDNQLPAAISDALSAPVAHTFRYLDEPPRLIAIGAVRPPEPARFDAQIDTLVSLGDVSTSVAGRIELDIKSGALDVVRVGLPEGLSLLDVSAPSLRRYAIQGEAAERVLRIELTQPVEGRLSIEVLAERISGQDDEVAMPFLSVTGAEVERGRIGVEARAAFQIDVESAERLSPLDASELPEQLLLRTDNPILHAYRYAQASPLPALSVRITRHGELPTLEAQVASAVYRTLYTPDGAAVTTAHLMVRNLRQQFLRVSLPEGSELWSARVDGHAEQPARESGSDEDAPVVLLNIVSAQEAFPVELVYVTPASRLGAFGRLTAELPRLDVVVTRTRWELFLPDGASYMEPSTSMTFVQSSPAMEEAWAPEGAPRGLSLEVPAEGVRYVFTSMYAASMNASGAPGSVSIPYVRGWGHGLALTASALGALLLWLGLLALAVLRLGLPVPAAITSRLPIALATYRASEEVERSPRPRTRTTSLALIGVAALGALLLLVSHGYLRASAWPAIAITIACCLGALGMALKHRADARRESAPAASA